MYYIYESPHNCRKVRMCVWGLEKALPSPPDPQIEHSHISSTWILHRADSSLCSKAAFYAPSLCIYFSSGPGSWTGWQNRIRNKGIHAHPVTFKSQKWSTLFPCSSNTEKSLCCSSGFHHLSDMKDFASSDRTSTNTCAATVHGPFFIRTAAAVNLSPTKAMLAKIYCVALCIRYTQNLSCCL